MPWRLTRAKPFVSSPAPQIRPANWEQQPCPWKQGDFIAAQMAIGGISRAIPKPDTCSSSMSLMFRPEADRPTSRLGNFSFAGALAPSIKNCCA